MMKQRKKEKNDDILDSIEEESHESEIAPTQKRK
jgi:hypothetical protein